MPKNTQAEPNQLSAWWQKRSLPAKTLIAAGVLTTTVGMAFMGSTGPHLGEEGLGFLKSGKSTSYRALSDRQNDGASDIPDSPSLSSPNSGGPSGPGLH